MKESIYNIYFKKDNNIVIYNSLNRSIVLLNKKEFKDFKKCLHKNLNITEEKYFVDNGFIVGDNINEIEIVKFNYKLSQYDTSVLAMTIAPTMDCIFRCPYCFEKREQGNMSEENQNKLINFVNNKVNEGVKLLSVLWFGGEPLMAVDVIKNLSQNFLEICKEKKIKYNAYIITNGYLINEKVVKNFIDYKISGVQITIDGPKYMHDKRRILASGDGSFDRIIENIKLLQKNKINIDIRINIDKTNYESIPELIDFFDKFEDKSYISFNFGHVLDYTENCSSISENCLSKSDFCKITSDFLKKIRMCGFPEHKELNIPTKSCVYCGAVKFNNYNIDSNLNLYRCWNEMTDKSKRVGNIKRENLDDNENWERLKYFNWNPFQYKKCIKCKYLPLCIGGCPFLGLKTGKPVCDKFKYQIKDIVEDYVNEQENYK